MNCVCGSTVIVLKNGVERCAECGKLAGVDKFVAFGSPLPPKNRKAAAPFEYRGHTVTPTDATTREGRPLYQISGPYVNERVCVGNERHRIDSGVIRNSLYGAK